MKILLIPFCIWNYNLCLKVCDYNIFLVGYLIIELYLFVSYNPFSFQHDFVYYSCSSFNRYSSFFFVTIYLVVSKLYIDKCINHFVLLWMKKNTTVQLFLADESWNFFTGNNPPQSSTNIIRRLENSHSSIFLY